MNNVTLYPALFLAEQLTPEGGTFVLIGLGVLGVLAWIAHNVLGAMASGRLLWGRKPPLDETMEKLRKELDGLAPSAQVDKLIEQLASFPTRVEVDLIRAQLSGCPRREELEQLRIDIHDQLTGFKTDSHNQLTEMRAYVHNGVHDIREDLNLIRLQSTEERGGIHGRLNAMTEVLYEMRGRMEVDRP
jgi:hypothetical protein